MMTLPLTLSNIVFTGSTLAICPRCTARPKHHAVLIGWITQLFRTSLNVMGVPIQAHEELINQNMDRAIILYTVETRYYYISTNSTTTTVV